MRSRIYIALLLCFTFAFTPALCTSNKEIDSPETWITVFVHGIMSIQPHVSLSNMVCFLRDEIENTVYAETVVLMRQDPFFNKNQAMQQPGLRPVDTTDMSPGNAPGAMGIVWNEMEKHAGFSKITNKYYTFGWNGLLSYSSRYKEAVRFFKELETLISNERKKGVNPKVRVIGYSHGGNVSLSLALAAYEQSPETDVTIDELVLISTPVQRETDFLINSPIFKRVYHIFSAKDRIQVLDFFNQNRFFSNQYFTQRKGFILPDKLIQIELRVTKVRKDIPHDSKHFEYTKHFEKKRVMLGRSKLLRDISPGHGEVWFFGWTPKYYRKHFPLNPLPMVSLFPFIRKHIAAAGQPEHPATLLVADLRPEHNTLLFKQRKGTKTSLLEIYPFMDKQMLNTLGKKIKRFSPPNYNTKTYKQRINMAAEKAKTIHHIKRHKRKHAHHKCITHEQLANIPD